MLGDGVKVLEHAVVGKQPVLSALDRQARAAASAELGAGTIVSTGAIVFAGSRIGDRVILGDQSCVRERVTVGDDVVLGRGARRERHDHRRDVEDPGTRVHHGVLDPRGTSSSRRA